MSTRSLIGIENDDGTVLYAYCHFDGYPSGVGRDVIDMGRRETRAMLKKGDMSTVGEPYGELRDRGDGFVPPRTVKDLRAFSDAIRSEGCDYGYVLRKSGAWMFASYSGGFSSLLRELKSDRRG